ncbi:MAG: hypothetical protein VW642_02320 [Halieaceae bacterium]
MFKKTLHTAVAAIALSTICLSVADAAPRIEGLILDFESMPHDFVEWDRQQLEMGSECGGCDFNPSDLNQITYELGTMSFSKKTVKDFYLLELPSSSTSGPRE